MSEPLEEIARATVERLDRIVSSKDASSEFHELSEVTRGIVRMRDQLIARLRSEGPGNGVRERLDRINAVLSLTAAAELPLQGIHWDRIKKARDALAEFAGASG
jgi:hypothetical protein